jgi:hypothetical protein
VFLRGFCKKFIKSSQSPLNLPKSKAEDEVCAVKVEKSKASNWSHLLRGGNDPAPGEKRPYAIKRRGATMRMRTKTVEMKQRSCTFGNEDCGYRVRGAAPRNSVTPL